MTKELNMRTSEKMQKAAGRIAPAWPLKNLIAVNPYLGFSEMSFGQTADKLNAIAGLQMTMPIAYYLKLFRRKQILMSDVEKALAKLDDNLTPQAFIQKCDATLHGGKTNNTPLVRTVGDAAVEVTEKDWNAFLQNKISTWAAAYFDEYQAGYASVDKSLPLFLSWKKDAEKDRSFRFAGLKKFRSVLKDLPNDPIEASDLVLNELNIKDEKQEEYLLRLLFNLIGWSSYISGVDWNNGLYSDKTSMVTEFIAIQLCVEYVLYRTLPNKNLERVWNEFREANRSASSRKHLKLQEIFQEALDQSYQRQLSLKLTEKNRQANIVERPSLQAVFCIDVRSEIYRRNLETLDSSYETKGYAGFFGFPIKYQEIGDEQGKNQCPALIPSGPVVKEVASMHTGKVAKRKVGKHEFVRSFKAFKGGPVSSFGFVSPLGLTYLPKLVGDAIGVSKPVKEADKTGHNRSTLNNRTLDLSGLSLEDKINMASGALTSMGFNERYAPFVLITGHGSTSVNNPHAAGLECGACGGHSGEANARTAALVFNDPEVRNGLESKGIHVPEDTVFVPALHNTTTDEIHILDDSMIPTSRKEAFNKLQPSLKEASNAARIERAVRLQVDPSNAEKSIFKRSNDWSQVRPEWGLAGCSAFVIADRKNTRGVNLGGKTFLNDYEWKSDESGKILESIMTAPMVVTSWINLQYYSSTVDKDRFGAGNKTLHNITGGIGVIEGAGGDLRIGLPIQSIHNGIDFEHAPNRLTVVIQAPKAKINAILEKHQSVKDLVDNGWIHLLTMSDDGLIADRYTGDLSWKEEQLTTKEQYELVNA